MSTTATLDHIVNQVRQLSPDDQAHLIQQIAEMLRQNVPLKRPRPLIYGEFKGDRMSTEEDFLIAEWHPNKPKAIVSRF